jgi:hypothetical protein
LAAVASRGNRGTLAGGRFAAAIVVALVATSTASAAITRRVTPTGIAQARAALLRRADLGRGWSGAPGGQSIPPLTCSGFTPGFGPVTEVGEAASQTFEQSSTGPFVAQDVYAYATPAQQAAVWNAVARSRLLRCVAESLSSGGGAGVRFAVTGKRLLNLPKLSVSAAGYRVSGTATSEGQSIDVFLDVLLVGSGQRISAISFSSFEQPAARQLELRLARTVARRMNAGSSHSAR